MDQCFCRKYKVEYHVKVNIGIDCKYLDIDRCRECAERAKHSYGEGEIEIIRLDGKKDDLTE